MRPTACRTARVTLALARKGRVLAWTGIGMLLLLRRGIPRGAGRSAHGHHGRGQADRFVDLMIASESMTTPHAASAAACGHNVSRPAPFRKIDRRMTR